jgi:hypothetical protein
MLYKYFTHLKFKAYKRDNEAAISLTTCTIDDGNKFGR